MSDEFSDKRVTTRSRVLYIPVTPGSVHDVPCRVSRSGLCISGVNKINAACLQNNI
jgi:hypothetical protein